MTTATAYHARMVNERTPTVWVDTNVLVEVYSHGDLHAAWQGGLGPPGAVDERRARMQGSLWMAMALCRGLVQSVHYGHEGLNVLVQIAPPGTDIGAWTSVVLYVLGDGDVLAGWERAYTMDGQGLPNRDRDRLMVRHCIEDGLILITRDQQVIREACAQMVDVVEPEDYAARVLERGAARAMFLQRLALATSRYVAQGGPPQERTDRVSEMGIVTELYTSIWEPL